MSGSDGFQQVRQLVNLLSIFAGFLKLDFSGMRQGKTSTPRLNIQ
jgi:hypothetical protein